MRRGIPLALVLCALPLLLAAACGDDATKTSSAATSKATGVAPTILAADPKPAPLLDGPASKYSILLDDVGLNAFITDIPNTFQLDAKTYGKTTAFPAGKGEGMLGGWSYLGGYQASMKPEGRDTAILNGSFEIRVETHLFKTADNAKSAYDYFVGVIKANPAAQAVTTTSVGNESTTTKAVNGKIRNTTIDAAYHQIIFRRGNMVAVVLTYGADPFMKVDYVRELASIIDNKALGKAQSIAPTPTSNYTPPAFSSETTSPKAGTPAASPTAAR